MFVLISNIFMRNILFARERKMTYIQIKLYKNKNITQNVQRVKHSKIDD